MIDLDQPTVFTVETMTPFPPNSNPFHHDEILMGERLGNNLIAMFEQHRNRDQRFIILFHKPTGQRIKIRINDHD